MEHNAKILLADDSHAIRFLVSEILTNAGFTVIEAEDGQEAIDKTYKENPDLLILDYEMPHKTGFDVVREVRSRTGYLHTPIIIFTAVSDKSTKLEGLGLDIDDYLTKPADEDEIVARVKLLLKRNKQNGLQSAYAPAGEPFYPSPRGTGNFLRADFCRSVLRFKQL